MGQCLSSSASGRAASEEPALQAGVHDRLIHPPVPAAQGTEAVVSQVRGQGRTCAGQGRAAKRLGAACCVPGPPPAHDAHDAPPQAKLSVDGSPAVPLLVRATPHHVFVALFEGLGEDRRSVAAFCRARVWEAYSAAAAAHPGSPLEALRDTLARLDAAVLASDRLKPAVGGRGGRVGCQGVGRRRAAASWAWKRVAAETVHPAQHPREHLPRPPPPPAPQAKARSGASAVLLLLEPGSGRVHCANVGSAACLLSRISGSFQAKAPEGFWLTSEHTTRWGRGRGGRRG